MSSLVAIITGGNKGIGLGISKLLKENNYKVITCGRSDFSPQNSIDGFDYIKVMHPYMKLKKN